MSCMWVTERSPRRHAEFALRWCLNDMVIGDFIETNLQLRAGSVNTREGGKRDITWDRQRRTSAYAESERH